MVVGTKPEPKASRVKPALPATTVLGLMLVSVSPLVIVKGSDCGCGTAPVMLTAALPGAVSRDAGTIAVSWFEDTKLVVSGVPLKVTRVPEGKPDPVKVMVNCGLPAGAVFGDTLISVTAGPPGGVTTPNTANPSVFEMSDPFCALMPAAP